jgi:hypothetical protein
VKTVREAETVLRTIRFQLTLATEKLPDGTGYELASLIAQQTGNLFISVPLTETCLWLPTVEKGVKSLGERSLNPPLLKTEAESILRTCDTANLALESARNGGRGSSVEIVRAEANTGVAVAAASGERFGRHVNEEFECGREAIYGGANAPRRQQLTFAEKSREHALRLVSEDVVWDLGALNKRWRVS